MSVRIRVVSVPAAHPYVDATADATAVEAVDPSSPLSLPQDAWAPSPVFETGWVSENAHRFDVCHVHFGFEGCTQEQIDRFCRDLSAHGKPLVLTIHDLANPQLSAAEQPAYRAKLGTLAAAASQLLTLTPGAAAQIEHEFGRRPIVVEHPPLDGPVQKARGAAPPAAVRTHTGRHTVGVLFKDARPSIDLDLVAALGRAIASQCPDWALQVVHHDRFRAGREEPARQLLAELSTAERCIVSPTERLGDDELAAWVSSLDLLALPYAHGTHSGLLELANDLGTRTLLPRIGYLGEQHRQVNVVLGSARQADIVSALRGATNLPELPPLTEPERHRRLRAFRLEHTAVYRRVCGHGRAAHTTWAPRRLSILLLSAFEHPIGQPHRGGLESHVWSLARELRRRGHRVALAAPEGSDFLDPAQPALIYPRYSWPTDIPRSDSRLPAELARQEKQALQRALAFAHSPAGGFDVIHDHSADPLPLLTPGPVPMVTTLHTPPTDEFLSALHGRRPDPAARLLTVSRHTAAAWAQHGIGAEVVANGVLTEDWILGLGGDRLCWFGRIVPEKAPHLAVAVARRLGAPLTIVGPVGDSDYAAEVFEPAVHAAGGLVSVRGALDVSSLAAVVAGSATALVTPDWDEPFGQVVAEALACGTPVAALARGGLRETFAGVPGVHLVPAHPDPAVQVQRLAEAAAPLLALRTDPAALEQARSVARAQAVERFSFDRTVDALEDHYRSVAVQRAVTQQTAAG